MPETNDPVIAGGKAGVWRYEVAPRSDAKVQLLTVGRVAVYGNWSGAYGEYYIAWCPVPKRDKKRERELGLLPPLPQNHIPAEEEYDGYI